MESNVESDMLQCYICHEWTPSADDKYDQHMMMHMFEGEEIDDVYGDIKTTGKGPHQYTVD